MENYDNDNKVHYISGIICSQVQTDSNAIEKEKLELKEHFARLNEKHVICEQSLCAALENVTSLESTQRSLQAEIQQMKHQLAHYQLSADDLPTNKCLFSLMSD